MKSVLKEITELFTGAIRTAMPIATEAAMITQCQKLALGHYQCNRCSSFQVLALSTHRTMHLDRPH